MSRLARIAGAAMVAGFFAAPGFSYAQSLKEQIVGVWQQVSIYLEEGGVSMTASGVALGLAGSPSVYEGRITGLEGSRISARVATGAKTIELQIALQLQQGQTRVTGVVSGAAA